MFEKGPKRFPKKMNNFVVSCMQVHQNPDSDDKRNYIYGRNYSQQLDMDTA